MSDMGSEKISRRKFIKISAYATCAVLLPGAHQIQAVEPTADMVLKNGFSG